MATCVLVHGDGHGWYFQWVARNLRAEGHEVSTSTLTGRGARAHRLDSWVDRVGRLVDVDAATPVHGQSLVDMAKFPIVCTSTVATRDTDLKARARAKGERRWDTDSGHDLMITEPGRKADALLQVAVA